MIALRGAMGMRGLMAMVVAISVAGCSSMLPRSGPSDRAIQYNAAMRVENEASDSIDYAFVDISEPLLSYFDDRMTTSLRDGFGGGRGTPAEATLGAGDVIQISIFESQAGGLFLPDGGGSSSGNYVTLPAQTIDRAGLINVPYAGAVKVAGRPVSEVQREIEGILANRAIEPQVIITTTLSRSNRLSILGDVNNPSELDMSPRGERVLDVISRAGGLTAPSAETYVTIGRNGQQATALFRTIVEDPRENIFVQPGDTIYVNRERRTYLAFGASGANGRFDFEDSDLTLGEALAKAGGLLDSRADPEQVFLYRQVERSILIAAGLPVEHIVGTGSLVPVIFRANLSDPSMFFAVQRFTMQDKDLLYVSNSSSTELSKFLNVVNGVSNTTSSVPVNAVNTRNAIEALGQ